MTKRVEEIRRGYDAHFVNGPHKECGWWARCTMVRDLLAALAQAERSMYAYAGALGYPIPADQDGRLLDGTFPKCGLCEAKDQLVAQAERERDETRAEVERLKEFADGIRGVAKEQRFRAEEAESQARTFETRWMAAVNDLARVRGALQKACLLFDQGYTDTALVPEPDEIEWREQARAALEGRG